MAYSYGPHYPEGLKEGKESQSVGHTVTEADFMMYSVLSGDWTEFHTNSEYAEDAQFGQRIAHGPMTLVQPIGFVYRLGIAERTAITFLGMNYMDLPNPVFIGDTLLQTTVVPEWRDLGSRDDTDLVVLEIEMTKRDGAVVLKGNMKFLIKTRSAAE